MAKPFKPRVHVTVVADTVGAVDGSWSWTRHYKPEEAAAGTAAFMADIAACLNEDLVIIPLAAHDETWTSLDIQPTGRSPRSAEDRPKVQDEHRHRCDGG